MEHVYTRDEIYDGPYKELAPDIVCVPKAGYDLKAKFDRTELFSHHGRYGTHTVEDAFFYDSAELQGIAKVHQVGASILRWFESHTFSPPDEIG